MALLHVTRQMVLPAKALGAILAQEVFAAGVHHHVAAYIFAGVEPALAVLAAVLLFFGPAGGLARVGFEVFQEDTSGGERLHAHLTGKIPTVGGMQGKVALEAQLGVVALSTLLAGKGLLVWVMSVEVIL